MNRYLTGADAECEQQQGLSFALHAATEADSDFLWRLTATTLRSYVAAVGIWDEDGQEQKFRREYCAAQWQILVVDGKQAGAWRLNRHDIVLFLVDIEILPEYQRRGIGTLLLRSLIAEAASRRIPLALCVLRSNPDARRLYERLGFSVVGPGLTPDYLLMAIAAPAPS